LWHKGSLGSCGFSTVLLHLQLKLGLTYKSTALPAANASAEPKYSVLGYGLLVSLGLNLFVLVSWASVMPLSNFTILEGKSSVDCSSKIKLFKSKMKETIIY